MAQNLIFMQLVNLEVLRKDTISLLGQKVKAIIYMKATIERINKENSKLNSDLDSTNK